MFAPVGRTGVAGDTRAVRRVAESGSGDGATNAGTDTGRGFIAGGNCCCCSILGGRQGERAAVEGEREREREVRERRTSVVIPYIKERDLYHKERI